MKKRYSYYLARSLITITGVIFITQFIFEFFGLVDRKSGFEWVIYICGAAFLLSLIYRLILNILNSRISTESLKDDLKETIMSDDYLKYIPCIYCYYYNRGRMCHHYKSIKYVDIITGQKFYYDCKYMRSNLCEEDAKLFKTRKLWQKLFKE
jgi:hypothetical protein